MANPLSDLGWSDKDYQAAIGTLVGEAAVKGGLKDFQAIADVIANRQADKEFKGKSVAGITMNPSQFSTWSPKQESAFKSAKAAFAAALDPTVTAKMSPATQARVELAKQAVADVNLTGVARGLTQGATAYHNATVTAKNGTDGWHKDQQEKYGSVKIGEHTFTGRGFDPNRPFDNVTYNGQLGVPEAAEPDWTGVAMGGLSTRYNGGVNPVPIGRVDRLEDLPAPAPSLTGYGSPAQYGEEQALGPYTIDAKPSYGVGQPAQYGEEQAFGRPSMSLESFAPVSPATPDFAGVHIGHTEQQALDNLGFHDQRPSTNVEIRHDLSPFGLSVDQQAAKNFDEQTTIDIGALSHAQIVDAVLPGTLAGITNDMDENPYLGAFPEATAFLDSPFADHSYISEGILHDAPIKGQGFHAGVDGWQPSPDFSAAPAPAPAAMAPSGYHAGVDGWGATPDFDAPSLTQRQDNMVRDNRIADFEAGRFAHVAAPPMETLNAALMAELAPAPTRTASIAPTAAVPASAPLGLPATSFDMQSMYADDMQDKLGMPRGLPSTSIAPQAVAPRQSVAPAPRVSAPVAPPQQLPALPSINLAPAPQINVQAQPAQPANPYSGFGNMAGVMGAIGTGAAAMPGGINDAWGRTAFSDSPYAGAAYNDVMDAAAKAGNMPERQSIFGGLAHDMGMSPTTAGKAGSAMKGAAIGGLFGGLPGAAIGGLNGYFGITDQIKDWAAGLFGGNSDYAGSGMAGDSYSNDRGFSDPGGWGLGNLGDSYGGFADGSAYGGSGGGSQGGFGGYGNADGSPSNDGPGIW